MQKLQNYFKSPDGGDILDTPINFRIVSLKGEKVTTDYGEKYKVKLKHIATDEDVFWELSEADIQKKFRNTYKDGTISWEAADGDPVYISKASPRTPEGRIFFKVERAETVSGEPVAPRSAKVVRLSDVPKQPEAQGVEWGGTPRQTQFRAGLMHVANAMMIAKSFPALTDEEKQEACDLFLWTREKADELEKMFPLH